MWFLCLKFEKSIIIPNNSFGWFFQTSHKLQKAYPFTQHYQSMIMFQENIFECSNFFFEGIKVHVTKMSINLVKKWFELSQLVLAMLLVQLFSAGMQLLSRVILIDETFVFALMAYRNLVAALCVAPLAFFFERFITILHYIFVFHNIRVIYGLLCNESDILFYRHQEKKFGWQVWLWIFLTALSG